MKITMFSKKNIMSGTIAGVIAGIVLSLMMMRMGVFTKVGGMMGMPNPLTGYLVHLVFSAIAGLIFAIIFYKATHTFFSCAIWGAIYGVAWWLLITTTIAQMMMGRPVSWSADTMAHGIPMLIGKLVFGFVLGVFYYVFRVRK
jgi:hypothetical protein